MLAAFDQRVGVLPEPLRAGGAYDTHRDPQRI